MKFDAELRRKVWLVLAVMGGFGAMGLWYWMHFAMAEERYEHQQSWPCASFESYPLRDVPLRCLPGAGTGKDGG